MLPDRFTMMLVATVVLACVFPATGSGSLIAADLTTLAVSLLFFLHGSRLSREAIFAAVKHWRLHTMVLCSTFVLFPILGILLRPLLSFLVGPELYVGIMYLCILPSTVQSSIAMVSIARGNVPAAVCSASASTLLGIFLTPLLAGMLLVANGNAAPRSGGGTAIISILLQLFLPFLCGQLLRPVIGGWVKRHAHLTKAADQGSILLVVYTAFSAAVIEGLWHQVNWHQLLGLVAANGVLLGAVLYITKSSSKFLGFNKEDEITIMFCGSKKSLASGVPMANILFSPASVGAILLPIMIFHQMQLMICAVIARRYATRRGD